MGASGDAIEFTKRYYNLEFQEAVEKLAAENGLAVSFHKSGGDRENTMRSTKRLRDFLSGFHRTEECGLYLYENRGMEDAILKKFGIGYADDSWDSLYAYFKKRRS